MEKNNVLNYLKAVLENRPADWLNLTTHRLDIYEEDRAKTQFLEQFEALYKANDARTASLSDLPTAYDYIRLGHPLSCIVEWGLAQLNELKAEQVISFSSKTMPILAVLRKNLLANKKTLVVYSGELPLELDVDVLQRVYGYSLEVRKVEQLSQAAGFQGSTIFVSKHAELAKLELDPAIDFYVHLLADLGSILYVNGAQNESYVSEIQHTRRRETVAMTPKHTLAALQGLVNQAEVSAGNAKEQSHKDQVIRSIQAITGAPSKALVASSGLSTQYPIMMGLIHHALEHHAGKVIKFIVPPNCYGGTNDQARRVADCLDHVEVVDLQVDGDQNMVQSLDAILSDIAAQDAVPFIIAEIPTNPRVEVPDLLKLQEVLSRERTTAQGKRAIEPVFVLDQTFCPNVHFLREEDILSTVQVISFVSGSKFPSGGLCTAGYCVANKRAESLMEIIETHLWLSDNEATSFQYETLARQLPSMNQRIQQAYLNTREFVHFIHQALPEAKINFVSQELATAGFTPSVFSLDLPTKGSTEQEREANKRALNLKLIQFMITQIPSECKFCVSYGQLKGSYWTIPATSTQGTTKEGDKDYIVRVSLSPELDLDRHKKTFLTFVENI